MALRTDRQQDRSTDVRGAGGTRDYLASTYRPVEANGSWAHSWGHWHRHCWGQPTRSGQHTTSANPTETRSLNYFSVFLGDYRLTDTVIRFIFFPWDCILGTVTNYGRIIFVWRKCRCYGLPVRLPYIVITCACIDSIKRVCSEPPCCPGAFADLSSVHDRTEELFQERFPD